MDDVKIPAADQERIDGMVRQYRNQIENLYRIAYLQGAIDEAEEARDKMRAEESNALRFAKSAGLA